MFHYPDQLNDLEVDIMASIQNSSKSPRLYPALAEILETMRAQNLVVMENTVVLQEEERRAVLRRIHRSNPCSFKKYKALVDKYRELTVNIEKLKTCIVQNSGHATTAPN